MNLLVRVLASAGDGSHGKVVESPLFTVEIALCANNRLAIDLVSDLNFKWDVIVVFVHNLDVAQFVCRDGKGREGMRGKQSVSKNDHTREKRARDSSLG